MSIHKYTEEGKRRKKGQASASPVRNRRIAPSTNWDTTSMSLPSAAYLPAVAVGMGSEGLDLYRFLALNQSVSLLGARYTQARIHLRTYSTVF